MIRNSPFVTILILSIIGFVLHFTWEFFQCSLFFVHNQTNPTLSSMIQATFGDLIMMGMVYFTVALTHHSWNWVTTKWTISTFIAIVLTSLFLAIFVELIALKYKRWGYTESNPLLPYLEVSIVPLLQMVIINPISFYSTKKIINRFSQ